jgi:PD-(D/E)XK nuclease superfamily protein
MRSLLQPSEKLSRHPVDVGERSEAIIIAELIKRGHRVLIPYGNNHRYDVVINVGGRFLRAQCKTGRLRDGVIRFNTVSTRINTVRTFITPYGADQIDLFLIYCSETDRVYALDVGEAASGHGALRVDPAANGQAKRIRWAADHELPA